MKHSVKSVFFFCCHHEIKLRKPLNITGTQIFAFQAGIMADTEVKSLS